VIDRRVLIASLALAVVACNSEKREFQEIPAGEQPKLAVKESELEPGGVIHAESTKVSYEGNAFALAEGKRLYTAMNCVGCHFHGGGGIGPPLMDDEWIYGSDPAQIFNTIVEGRPNGMPSFKGKLTNPQVWQIVSYVRSMNGLGGSTVSSARDDHMNLSPNLAIRSPQKPKNATAPFR
jgi:cytochrome c oxidase cbb3-type subunit 3